MWGRRNKKDGEGHVRGMQGLYEAEGCSDGTAGGITAILAPPTLV